MKMNQLFTAHYSDGRTEHERSLSWIYENQHGAGVTVTPAIWIWGSGGTYYVDFVGSGTSCTLGAFSGRGALTRATEFAERCVGMERDAFVAWLQR